MIDPALHSASATLLVAIDPTWRPRGIMREANLNEATLNRVRWPGIDLRGANLNNASLNDADLSNARLAGATFLSASLRGANLQGANLTGGATLAYADANRCAVSEGRSHRRLSLKNPSWTGRTLTARF